MTENARKELNKIIKHLKFFEILIWLQINFLVESYVVFLRLHNFSIVRNVKRNIFKIFYKHQLLRNVHCTTHYTYCLVKSKIEIIMFASNSTSEQSYSETLK